MNDVVGGLDITVAVDPDDLGSWLVVARDTSDGLVDLVWHGGRLVDVNRRTTWLPSGGVGTGGTLDGEPLTPIAALTSFPRDYESFWPDGRTWRP